ncbi:hypothetical protein ACFLZW_06700 [Chloroflexota bacterium]
MSPISLAQKMYQQRLLVEKLQQEVFQLGNFEEGDTIFEELKAAEASLAVLEGQMQAELNENEDAGLLVDYDASEEPTAMLGAQTTGLSAKVYLRMEQVPTSIYHLFDRKRHPLVSCKVINSSRETRRLRVISYIEYFSAQAVDTFELEMYGEKTFDQLPTLFRERLGGLNELERASLNVLVEDLDSKKIEVHSTHPIWLLARTTAPFAVKDPKTNKWQDLSTYLGAFVTPNAHDLMKFVRFAAELHPEKRLVGYQGTEAVVEAQVTALFDALQQEADIKYINSRISFSPEQGAANQRVRLPRESIKKRSANCVDGAVLFASLLEAISMSPALVVVPGHAFVAWETWKDAPGQWKYLETTMIGSHSFLEAHQAGEVNAARYKALAEVTGKPDAFKLLPLRELRADYGIMPME